MVRLDESQAIELLFPYSCSEARRPAWRGTPARGPARGLLSDAAVRSGYLPRSEIVDQVVNRSIAALLLAVFAPVFALVIALQKSLSRGDVFYRGIRLGKDRRPFTILKFRTLEDTASALTVDRTLPRRNLCETRFGSYLRITRLDELPQLINILRGEMVFFGPRPIRPEIEWKYAEAQHGHAQRFAFRPGLVGMAQALMSHDAPKALRGRFNSMCYRAHVDYPRVALFLAYVGLCVAKKTGAMGLEALRDAWSPLGGHRWLRAGFAGPAKARVEVAVGSEAEVGAVCGISDELVQFVATQPVAPGRYRVALVRDLRRGRRVRVPVDLVIHTVLPLGLGRAGFAHYARYAAESPLTAYRIDRYFIGTALCA